MSNTKPTPEKGSNPPKKAGSPAKKIDKARAKPEAAAAGKEAEVKMKLTEAKTILKDVKNSFLEFTNEGYIERHGKFFNKIKPELFDRLNTLLYSGGKKDLKTLEQALRDIRRIDAEITAFVNKPKPAPKPKPEPKPKPQEGKETAPEGAFAKFLEDELRKYFDTPEMSGQTGAQEAAFETIKSPIFIRYCSELKESGIKLDGGVIFELAWKFYFGRVNQEYIKALIYLNKAGKKIDKYLIPHFSREQAKDPQKYLKEAKEYSDFSATLKQKLEKTLDVPGHWMSKDYREDLFRTLENPAFIQSCLKLRDAGIKLDGSLIDALAHRSGKYIVSLQKHREYIDGLITLVKTKKIEINADFVATLNTVKGTDPQYIKALKTLAEAGVKIDADFVRNFSEEDAKDPQKYLAGLKGKTKPAPPKGTKLQEGEPRGREKMTPKEQKASETLHAQLQAEGIKKDVILVNTKRNPLNIRNAKGDVIGKASRGSELPLKLVDGKPHIDTIKGGLMVETTKGFVSLPLVKVAKLNPDPKPQTKPKPKKETKPAPKPTPQTRPRETKEETPLKEVEISVLDDTSLLIPGKPGKYLYRARGKEGVLYGVQRDKDGKIWVWRMKGDIDTHRFHFDKDGNLLDKQEAIPVKTTKRKKRRRRPREVHRGRYPEVTQEMLNAYRIVLHEMQNPNMPYEEKVRIMREWEQILPPEVRAHVARSL